MLRMKATSTVPEYLDHGHLKAPFPDGDIQYPVNAIIMQRFFQLIKPRIR